MKITERPIFELGKKAQSEIIGLAIVVVLLIFALIFFVSVKNNDDNVDTRLIRTNLRANSALNALMKVNVGEDQMNKLIEDCLKQKPEKCDLTHGSLKTTLESVFDEDYYFRILDLGNEVLIVGNKEFSFGVNCKTSISASPYVFRGLGKAELKICT